MKIMFVCHGNICRSPMAEFVMKKFVQEQHLEKEISISSSAVSTEEIGNPVYPPARKKSDLFLVMDNSNLFYICRIFPSDPKNKIHKLLEYAGRSDDVADPWYTGDFEKAYQDIYEGCLGLLEQITGGNL